MRINHHPNACTTAIIGPAFSAACTIRLPAFSCNIINLQISKFCFIYEKKTKCLRFFAILSILVQLHCTVKTQLMITVGIR